MIKLSICIATLNRADYIAATLDSILPQLTPETELVVVDGASTDGTSEILQRYAQRSSQLRYFREPTNSGVDADYDKAVNYAQGEFCWLMTDDDLLVPDAVANALGRLDDSIEALIVNAAVMDIDVSRTLVPQLLKLEEDRDYLPGDQERFFREVGDYLTFIGGVVVRRAFWLARDRQSYFGSLFIHAAVLFQSPAVARARVLARPLILIRYGNAMWTARTFEIWMFKWPSLIWSFPDFSSQAKQAVVLREPWKNAKRLFFYRALGRYTRDEYQRFIADKLGAGTMQKIIANFPLRFANALVSLYCWLFNRDARTAVYDLARARHATAVSRFVARRLGMQV